MSFNVSILDCTLRDGGYYNNWKFENVLVKRYISAASLAGIDIIEIGFRFLSTNNNYGDYAYCDDKFLNQLDIPKEISVAVMIDAKEYIDYEIRVGNVIESVFKNKKESRIDIVRIATNIKDIKSCELFAKQLKNLGYKVFINLMKADTISYSNLLFSVQEIESWKCIDVIYFADSFGNMDTDSIRCIVETIKLKWLGGLGIHAHDNKGSALINTLRSFDFGVNYLDATILGMGRGAGNAKMENLLIEMSTKGIKEYRPDAIISLALKEFSHLKDRYKWGSNMYYYLSAIYGVHPTYVQEMLSEGRYEVNQILSAIRLLKEKVSSSYSLKNMTDALCHSTGNEFGGWSAKNWLIDKETLIVGSGPSTKKYLSKIKEYIKINNPIVLCLNVNSSFPKDLVYAYITCHEARIPIEMDLYKILKKPVILPLSRIPNEIINILYNVNILDYGLKIEKNNFHIYENGCILERPLALIYALSLLSVTNTKKVSLVGMDGYLKDNKKQQETFTEIEYFLKSNESLNIVSLTPTTYPFKQELII